MNKDYIDVPFFEQGKYYENKIGQQLFICETITSADGELIQIVENGWRREKPFGGLNPPRFSTIPSTKWWKEITKPFFKSIHREDIRRQKFDIEGGGAWPTPR